MVGWFSRSFLCGYANKQQMRLSQYDEKSKSFVQVHHHTIPQRATKTISKRDSNTEYMKYLYQLEKEMGAPGPRTA
jgi:hypothetical protein